MKTGPVLLFVVCFSVAVFFFRAHGPERQETAVFAAVDRLWQEAVMLGFDPDRKPQVAFVGKDETPLAQTMCLSPRPVIEINRERMAKVPAFVAGVVVPHEMGHVLVCVGGSRADWDQRHGEPWQTAVRLLVDHDEAEDIIALELALEPAPLTGTDVTSQALRDLIPTPEEIEAFDERLRADPVAREAFDRRLMSGGKR